MPTRIDIRLRRTRQLDAATRAAIVELCTAAHQADFSRLFFYLPTDGMHFLTYRETQIVGHAVVTTRWVQPEHLPILRTAYVDAVAILPGYQRRGLGSALMRELAAHLGEYDLACLETEQPAFFEQLGWERWRGPRAGRAAGNKLIRTPDEQNILILRVSSTPPLDLNGLLTIESQPARIW